MSQATSPSQDPAEGQSHPLIFSRPFACTRCQQRKVKCDRADTCSNCVKGPFDCVYVNPQPAQKRKRKAPADESLSAKLQRYEELLRSNGIEVDETPSETPTHAQGRVKSLLKHNPNKTAPPQPSTQTANLGGDPYAQCRKGKLIAEGDGWRYVEELFWSSGVNDEVVNLQPDHYDFTDLSASSESPDPIQLIPGVHRYSSLSRLLQLFRIAILQRQSDFGCGGRSKPG